MSHVDTPFQAAVWPTWVGKQVRKVSGKPFKSKEKLNTVTAVAVHPITGHLAFTFAEDDSQVECFRTSLVSGKPAWSDAPSWALGVAVKCYGEPGEFGEWCWMSPLGAQGFICYESRPVSHMAAADERVREIIQANLDFVAANKEAYRLTQQARDLARNRKKA